MTALFTLWAKEPARLIGFVQAAIMLLVAFGVPLTDDQTAKIIAAVAAAVALLGGEIIRSQVSSPATVAKPQALHDNELEMVAEQAGWPINRIDTAGGIG